MTKVFQFKKNKNHVNSFEERGQIASAKLWAVGATDYSGAAEMMQAPALQEGEMENKKLQPTL